MNEHDWHGIVGNALIPDVHAHAGNVQKLRRRLRPSGRELRHGAVVAPVGGGESGDAEN